MGPTPPATCSDQHLITLRMELFFLLKKNSDLLTPLASMNCFYQLRFGNLHKVMRLTCSSASFRKRRRTPPTTPTRRTATAPRPRRPPSTSRPWQPRRRRPPRRPQQQSGLNVVVLASYSPLISPSAASSWHPSPTLHRCLFFTHTRTDSRYRYLRAHNGSETAR